jgi:elongation factor 1-gamma
LFFFSAAKAETDMAAALQVLNDYLLDKTYLVNDQITLADIVLAATLVYPFKLVCDKNFLKPYGNVVRWFSTCVNQPEFAAVVGKVDICKKSLAPASSSSKKSSKKSAKKEEAAPEPVVVVKKTEHPYKIMDKDAPSKFNMDAWKKKYSNAKSYDEAFDYFWQEFDAEGWTLWYQVYKFNEDNTRTFMTSNAIGGFQQRTDEVRKWAFGVMDVLGTEETLLEIRGIWLLRGDTVDHLVAANDDANWYDWTKLAGKGLAPTDEVKEQVKAFWTEEEKLEGKQVQDSKVFK